ncbi:hypothetical protein [Spirosoma arboris]|uniref:hypothetical protein n=1 Tax=Spirosoma arboris TaxID=2682092 RepID=UPI001D1216B5|nr:hypothetical protein [Spirosoma arboris]
MTQRYTSTPEREDFSWLSKLVAQQTNISVYLRIISVNLCVITLVRFFIMA